MTDTAAPRILIMAGGTGGHVFPALATATVLQESGVAIEWLGSQRGIENDLVPKAGYKLHSIAVTGLRGKGRLSILLAPFKLIRALFQAWQVLRAVKPDSVLGMGGFASGPGGLAAWLLGIPVCIHEQNAIPGMTNKLLARFSKRVMEAFPGAFPSSIQALCTGNPVRANIIAVSPPEQRFSVRDDALRLLIVGGSLGARAINQVVPKALAMMPAEQRPQVWHQTGVRNLEDTKSGYQTAGVEARIDAFIDDMNTAYDWADLVICRAGALTVSELSAAGVAAILVPYPYAVDDHQRANARFLSDHDAGVLLPETELTEERLLKLLNELSDRARLQQIASNARKLGRIDASQRVAEQCLRAASGVAA